MSYKILVTGTLDSGKTTLLTALKERSDVYVVREVAQDFIDQYGYEVTQRREFQDMVFAEQLNREVTAEASGAQFILCDRGTIDIVAFSTIIGHPIKPEWEASLRGHYDAATIFNKDDILFQPELYNVPFDMTEYRTVVDHSIRNVLIRTGLSVVEISGTHEARLNLFNDLLKRLSQQEGNQMSSEGQVIIQRKERQ